MSSRRAIQKLPTLLVNQIAAGEVVERPASVVKELVDNALDAGATRITIELDQGGIELIRVSDDGHGIPEGELPLALAPHATSKVREAGDLERIATMGFRGEALASIASVARVQIRSRTAEQPAAAMIEAEGDAGRPAAPASGPVGTAVTVRNLFFNTPARRKFLRAAGTEQGRCADVVRDLAMSHPAVAFTLSTDGRRALDVPADQAPRDRVIAILGAELAGQLLEVDTDDPGPPGVTAADRAEGVGGPIGLWGLIGRPSIARATGAAQHVFLNGRPIRDKTVLHALREAFRGLIEPSRYPTAVLMLEMDPAAADVNVHPAKIEVRFREPSRVHGLIFHAVRAALQRADLTPRVGVDSADTARAGQSPAVHDARAILPEPRGSTSHPSSSSPPANAGARGFVDHFQRDIPTRAAALGGRIDFDALRSAVERDAASDAPAAEHPASPVPPPARAIPGEPGLPTPTIAPRLLQVHNSFLVTQDEQGVVIIDQHALHERVMFQRLLDRLGTGTLESQQLLVPERLPASNRQLEALDTLRPLLIRLGIDAVREADAVVIRAFATFLFDRGVEPAAFLAEVLDRAAGEAWPLIGSGPTGEEAVLHEVLDMMACKAAIKAGDRLSEGELADLLAMREHVERASNCPHGRPTSIRLTIQELERRFGRS